MDDEAQHRQHVLHRHTCEEDHKVPSCCHPFNKNKAENKVSELVWCVNSGATWIEDSRTLPNPLQRTAYSKRIISPIPWCHYKATEALAHGEPPPLQPLLAFSCQSERLPPITISSQVEKISPAGRRWQELLHMLRPLFHALAAWVAEQLTNCPQETYGASKGAIQSHQAICSLTRRCSRLGRISSGNGHFVMFNQSDRTTTDTNWIPHTPSTKKLLSLHPGAKAGVGSQTKIISSDFLSPNTGKIRQVLGFTQGVAR